MNDIFKSIYYNPSRPGSLGGVNQLFKSAKLLNRNIKLKDAIEWLKTQNVYTLHKSARNRFPTNRIYVSYENEQWEVDIVDMNQLSRFNNGYKYIIVCVDSFTKYAYTAPTRTKKAIEVLAAMKKIFNQQKPVKLRSDKGGEFDNRIFKNFCKTNGINHFTTTNKKIKCAIVERLNRTLKGRIYRYFTLTGKWRYIDVLQNITDSYNHTVHRSTGMAPADIKPEHRQHVFQKLYKAKNLLSIMKQSFNNYKFKVGDTVRLRYDLSSLDKRYHPLWTDIIYKIDKIYNKLTKPQYLISFYGEQLDQKFYPEDLQQVTVDENTFYPIDKVVRYREVNGQTQALVKWKGYPQRYNQWVPVEHLKRQRISMNV